MVIGAVRLPEARQDPLFRSLLGVRSAAPATLGESIGRNEGVTALPLFSGPFSEKVLMPGK